MRILENKNPKLKNHIASHMELPICGHNTINTNKTIIIDYNISVYIKIKYNICENCYRIHEKNINSTYY